MPLAALAVHQLRYYLTYGDQTARELGAQGHAYLTSLTPWIVILAAVAFGGFLIGVARAWTDGRVEEAPFHSTRRLWAIAAIGLLAIYVGQELLEGLLATGHAPGVSGVLGQGGWWSLPASLLVGGLVALGLRGARAIVALVAHRRGLVQHATTLPAVSRRRPVFFLAPPPLACCAAGRAPPSFASVAR